MTKTVHDLQPGDLVYVKRISRSFNAATYIYKATLVKATPTGQCVVKLNGSGEEVRFNKDGREVGQDGWGRFLALDTAQVEREIALRLAAREEQQALSDVKTFAAGMTATTADVARLEDLVALLKAKMVAAGLV